MTDTLRQLSDEGVAIWLDDLSRDRLRHRQPGRPDPRPARRRRHHQPDDLPEGAQRQRRLRPSSSRDLARARRRRRRGAAHDHHLRRPLGLRRAAAGLRRHRRRRRPGLHRGRPAAGPRHRARPSPRPRQLWWLVDRPNLFIKIPATEAGLPAITAVPRRGHQRQRHADLLARALRRGHGRLPRRPGAGQGDRARPVQHRLGGVVLRQPGRHRGRQAAGQDRHRRRPTALRGKAAIANARLAYQPTRRSSPPTAGQALAAAGAKPQRPLWASTGVKDPAYDDTMYVVDLVAPGMVNTMPEATLDAVADHGVDPRRHDPRRVRATRSDGARRPGRRSASTTTTSCSVLEDEGVEKFEASWNELLESTQSPSWSRLAEGGQPVSVERPHRRRAVARRRRQRPDRAGATAGSPVAQGRRRCGARTPRPRPPIRLGWLDLPRDLARRCSPSCASCASG